MLTMTEPDFPWPFKETFGGGLHPVENHCLSENEQIRPGAQEEST